MYFKLIAAINDTLRTSLHTPDEQSFHYSKETGLLEVPDLRLSSIVPVEDRSDMEITGKCCLMNKVSMHEDKSLTHTFLLQPSYSF